MQVRKRACRVNRKLVSFAMTARAATVHFAKTSRVALISTRMPSQIRIIKKRLWCCSDTGFKNVRMPNTSWERLTREVDACHNAPQKSPSKDDPAWALAGAHWFFLSAHMLSISFCRNQMWRDHTSVWVKVSISLEIIIVPPHPNSKMGVTVLILPHKRWQNLHIFQDKYTKSHRDQMLWCSNAVYLSNCIHIIMLNATRDIFQILSSPPNVIITNESPEWSCALFMPRSDTATGTSHLVKVTHSQPAKGEWSSLATVPRLLATFGVAPNRPWSSISYPSHR